MSSNNRKAGYYRVKYKGEWIIGKYIPDDSLEQWALPETEYYYYDNELDQIDETEINPEPENKQPYEQV